MGSRCVGAAPRPSPSSFPEPSRSLADSMDPSCSVPFLASLLLLMMRICALQAPGEWAEPCPERTPEKGRGCPKSCLQDGDCPARRRCLCNGSCGLSCVAPGRSCPWPLDLPNAVAFLLSPAPSFSARLQVHCLPGFRMANGSEILIRRCQADRSWSGPEPTCVEVTTVAPPSCPQPEQIENGFTLVGTITVGSTILYGCNPGFDIVGVRRNECGDGGVWQQDAPVCQRVYCAPPVDISQGYLVAVQRKQYDVGEVIYYLCKKGFLMDGPNRVTCLANGTWSPTPFCRARCPVPVQRSRILLGGVKLWPYDVPVEGVQHGDEVSFYCRDAGRQCSFTARQRCHDGTLPLPGCYQEPTWLQYKLFPHRLVSEIKPCEPSNLQ
ncbi:beta-2-glycoprotein 1-like [Lepisosteus oculatus]|uniref:beta-2-glycoprotein 1-like n=1 Tax=Lepisosteus oculatus TaxID=7918 RepID=UPI003722BB9B